MIKPGPVNALKMPFEVAQLDSGQGASGMMYHQYMIQFQCDPEEKRLRPGEVISLYRLWTGADISPIFAAR